MSELNSTMAMVGLRRGYWSALTVPECLGKRFPRMSVANLADLVDRVHHVTLYPLSATGILHGVGVTMALPWLESVRVWWR